MTMKPWRAFSYVFIAIGGALIIWGFVARSNTSDGVTGLAGNIQGQAMIFSGAIMILVALINLVVYKFFRPLTDASDNLMISQGYKPGFGGTMKMAAGSMAQANATMAAFNAGPAMADQLAVSGVDGTATVTGSRPTGRLSNLNPVYELDMTVTAATMAPFEVTHTSEVNTLRVAQVGVGRRLPVRVNPTDPTQMLVQWEKVPV